MKDLVSADYRKGVHAEMARNLALVQESHDEILRLAENRRANGRIEAARLLNGLVRGKFETLLKNLK